MQDDIRMVNVLVLAYIGDSVYENFIRHYLVSNGISNVSDLQKESIKYVSAKAQSKYMYSLIDNNILNDDELGIYKRARNYKSDRHPKNTDIVTYKVATGFEAIIGYLDLTGNSQRLSFIVNYVIGV